MKSRVPVYWHGGPALDRIAEGYRVSQAQSDKAAWQAIVNHWRLSPALASLSVGDYTLMCIVQVAPHRTPMSSISLVARRSCGNPFCPGK